MLSVLGSIFSTAFSLPLPMSMQLEVEVLEVEG
jgi:hypothetical protein